MRNIHLICNAHLDPVWLWEWEEGTAEAISTFRTAADFCEEYNGFIFNHNEALLYKWVEEYEPDLFLRIQKLVRQGKWHIMGGWFLQPDCNMPSGESFVRQISLGRAYFMEKFGEYPTTAINFDSFGHSQGLVQIMKKAGFDSYVFCRPSQEECFLPSEDFLWVGNDGSEIKAHRATEFYNSPRGEADKKVLKWMEEHRDSEFGMILWGVGNHGGGPSRLDIQNLGLLIEENKENKIKHSIPEEYFEALTDRNTKLPKYEKDLNACNVGCYTSQIRIKQKHRLIENELYMVEKMLACAALQGYLKYPENELNEAFCDLMISEFHDALPGTSIQPVEDATLRLLDHGLEIASRLKTKAFFALSSGQKKAEEGQIPILVYNPHPYRVKGIFECEFQLPDQNWKDEFSLPLVYQDGEKIPSQAEKELSNLNLDWRKRVVFETELKPSQMNRFDCMIEVLPRKPLHKLKQENDCINFKTNELDVVINCKTGFMDKYRVKGVDFLKLNSFVPLVIDDNDDPWGMTVKSFRNILGEFKLMSREEGTRISGVKDTLLNSVRVIEDGDVRVVIEAVFSYGDSFICQNYKLPKHGTEIQIQTRVLWNEKSKMLKLSVPTLLDNARYVGQVAYGIAELSGDGNETVSQKWSSVISSTGDLAFTCINDCIYGSDFCNGELRISLLRSSGYSGHPILERTIMPQDRYSSRIDQGERVFNFWFNAGKVVERMNAIDREAMAHNEKPMVLSFFPSGMGTKTLPLIELSDDSVQMTVFKKSEVIPNNYIIRLFEPTGIGRTTVIKIPALNIVQEVHLGKFEIKSFKVDLVTNELFEVGLIERTQY